MTTENDTLRRFLSGFTRAGAVLSAVMLVTSLVSIAADHDPIASAAGVSRGALGLRDESGTITGGGSGPFTPGVPTGSACQGSGSSGYIWQTFLAAGSVDVGSLTFGPDGPNPVGTALVTPLYSVDGEAVVSRYPSASPVGLISGIPQVSLAQTVVALPAGSYNLGVACSFGGAMQDYWSTTIYVTAKSADSPLGIAWSTTPPPAPTTTTSSTTTSSTTSTTVAPGSTTSTSTTSSTTSTSTSTTSSTTTTTVRPGTTTTTTTTSSTTTTVRPGTTTTSSTIAGAGVTTTTSVGSGGPLPTVPRSGGTLPATGSSSSLPVLVWGLLVVVFGRFAVLFAKPIRVRRERS